MGLMDAGIANGGQVAKSRSEGKRQAIRKSGCKVDLGKVTHAREAIPNTVVFALGAALRWRDKS